MFQTVKQRQHFEWGALRFAVSEPMPNVNKSINTRTYHLQHHAFSARRYNYSLALRMIRLAISFFVSQNLRFHFGVGPTSERYPANAVECSDSSEQLPRYCMMTSFITTMFVSTLFQSFSPKPPPAAPQPTQSSLICTSPDVRTRSPTHTLSGTFKGDFADDIFGLPDDISRNARTRGQFKPRNANKGTSSYQLRQFAEATLGSGSLRKAVKLPEGEDLNEWLAVNGEAILHQPSLAFHTAQHWRLIVLDSRRLLQPDKPAIWLHH